MYDNHIVLTQGHSPFVGCRSFVRNQQVQVFTDKLQYM